jgi:Ca-activated chloride channel homolog
MLRRDPRFYACLGLCCTLVNCSGLTRDKKPGVASPESMAIGAAPPLERAAGASNTESYERIDENPFLAAARNPLSTFSIDVDTASYSNVRRLLKDETLPPKDAVRIEELVNYFPYEYREPDEHAQFAVHTEVSAAPWNVEHRLVHIGLQGRRIEQRDMPARNLVFFFDVSGSMAEPNKLPLELVQTLGEKDRVAIVVYAGASGLVLPPTPASSAPRILEALDRLEAGGSTNGGEA